MRHDLDPKYNIVHYICMYDCILYSFLPINRCNNQLKICTKESRNHSRDAVAHFMNHVLTFDFPTPPEDDVARLDDH